MAHSSRHDAKKSDLKVGWTQTMDVLDFVTAYKSLERREQEERQEERQVWRSYGDGRVSEFNGLVAEGEQANQSAEQSQKENQSLGLGQSFSQGMK